MFKFKEVCFALILTGICNPSFGRCTGENYRASASIRQSFGLVSRSTSHHYHPNQAQCTGGGTTCQEAVSLIIFSLLSKSWNTIAREVFWTDKFVVWRRVYPVCQHQPKPTLLLRSHSRRDLLSRRSRKLLCSRLLLLPGGPQPDPLLRERDDSGRLP